MDTIPASRALIAAAALALALGSTPSALTAPANACLIDESQQAFASVYFTYGSAEIVPSAEELLDTLAEIFAEDQADAAITIVGHDGVGSDPASHVELSESRAQAVADYLVVKGIDPARITVTSRGASKPLQPGRTALNHRVEIYLH